MPSNDASAGEDKDSDVVLSILNGTLFKLRPDGEKLAIIQKGRPMPNLSDMKQGTSRNSYRTLHSSWYSTYKWLCGSKTYNKFFCWPCLLMRPETSSWCSIGNDATRLSSLATKHARCKSHLKAIHEYDETLINLKLTPESKFLCEEECTSDKTEVDDDESEDDDDDGGEEDEDDDDDDDEGDDSVNLFLYKKEGKEDVKEVSCNNKVKISASGTAKTQSPSKTTGITFKTWQELYRDTFPVSKARLLQDFQLYKWKKKVAKQELRNARLTGEKIKFEIDVLKMKLKYYKALKEDASKGPQPTTTLSV